MKPWLTFALIVTSFISTYLFGWNAGFDYGYKSADIDHYLETNGFKCKFGKDEKAGSCRTR